jgi:hypothetical protein
MQAPTEPTDIDRDRTTVDAPATLERDEVFRLLQSGRRRRVVRHLLGFVDEPVPVDALATAITRAEHDDPAEGLDPEVRDRVAMSLDHSHLPQLEAAGVLAHDRTLGRVTATPAMRQLEPYLETDSESADPETTTTEVALAGVAGGSLATLLALRKWTAAGLAVAALLVLSALRSVGGREQRRR